MRQQIFVRPKISVIVCAYNYARFLPDCLNSVLTQTVAADEIILVDDGSTDETREVARQFPKICYVWQSHGGKASAFNRGFQSSHGDLVCHLDADDYWERHKLEAVTKALVEHADVGGAVHDVLRVDVNKAMVDRPRTGSDGKLTVMSLEDVKTGGFLYRLPGTRGRFFGATNTICVRRKAVDDMLPMPDHIGLSVDGFLVATAQRSGLLYIPQPLAYYREHERNYFLGNTRSDLDTVLMWEYLLASPDFKKFLTPAHVWLLKAKIMERRSYVSMRTGEKGLRGAVEALRLLVLLLRSGYLFNWKHLFLPVACVLPVRRQRQPG